MAKGKATAKVVVGAESSETASQPLDVETVGSIVPSSRNMTPRGSHNNFAGKYNPFLCSHES